MSRALVLGGGGVAGIAWETGVLLGLTEGGVDVLAADLVVGTSAGSTVAAQVTSRTSLDHLFDRYVAGTAAAAEIAVDFDAERMMTELVPLLAQSAPGQEMRAAVGRWALSAETVEESVRHAVIEQRLLPSQPWPRRAVRIVAVDAETGETRVFDEGSEVALVDAVAASCAVPGIWPPVTIEGRRYVDGGIRSSTNVDLAAGHDAVLVLAPVPDLGPADPQVQAAVAELERTSAVLTIRPDEASQAAIGANPLDPQTQRPAALAGRAQGSSLGGQVRTLWQR